MTGNEVVALLAYMSSAWPSVEITEDTGRMWTKQLDKLHPDDALAAADTLIRTSKWLPSVAELLEAARPHTRRRVEAEQAADYERKALAEGPVVGSPRENLAQLRATMRQMIAAQKGFEHKHGKLGPCQVPGCPSTRIEEPHVEF